MFVRGQKEDSCNFILQYFNQNYNHRAYIALGVGTLGGSSSIAWE